MKKEKEQKTWRKKESHFVFLQVFPINSILRVALNVSVPEGDAPLQSGDFMMKADQGGHGNAGRRT